MKKSFKWSIILLAVFLLIWAALTIWAEKEGSYYKLEIGNNGPSKKALIIYDPDPFYNLDQQVFESFGTVLARNNYNVTIATVVAVKNIKVLPYNLYVFSTKTYNWEPDWAITQYIEKQNSFNPDSALEIYYS